MNRAGKTDPLRPSKRTRPSEMRTLLAKLCGLRKLWATEPVRSVPIHQHAAVLIDADNVSPHILDPLLEMLQPEHMVVVVRIYRNFASSHHKRWNGAVGDYGAVGVQTPTIAGGKNAADMHMTVDAMDLLHRGVVRTFVLVSNDGDFAPLAIRLAADGCKVIGFGTGRASAAFRAACSEFRTIEGLLGAATRNETS